MEAQENDVVAGVLWSDPVQKPGTSNSSRGIGVFFGPDITKRFLGNYKMTNIMGNCAPGLTSWNFLFLFYLYRKNIPSYCKCNLQGILVSNLTRLLCILTSERVLLIPFAGQNHLFLC